MVNKVLAFFGLLVVTAVGVLGANTVVLPRVESQQGPFRVVEVIPKLDSPWGGVFLPDGTLLGTFRKGGLWSWKAGVVKNHPLPLALDSRGQGGLLDLALSPQFTQTPWVFFTYAQQQPGGSRTALGRFLWTGEGPVRPEILWEGQRVSANPQHYGSRIAFGTDGFLYMTLGERNEPDRAQDPKDLAGKILRLTPEGKPAPGNPNLGGPGEIFALGSRNAQGLAVEPGTGRVWFTEHGPRGGDEVNLLIPGVNYGWPRVTFGVQYSGLPVSNASTDPRYESPLVHWTPSIAPSGLMFYTGDKFPAWKRNLFSGNLAGQELRRLTVSPEGQVLSQESLLKNKVGRIRTVVEGPEGFLYLLIDGPGGKVLRLEPL